LTATLTKGCENININEQNDTIVELTDGKYYVISLFIVENVCTIAEFANADNSNIQVFIFAYQFVFLAGYCST
jgi:hypothetical protein